MLAVERRRARAAHGLAFAPVVVAAPPLLSERGEAGGRARLFRRSRSSSAGRWCVCRRVPMSRLCRSVLRAVKAVS